MPRIPSTAYSFLLRVTTVVLGIAGLCAVALCLMIHDALLCGARELLESACAKETVGTKIYRLWLTWWRSPSRSTLSKNKGWSSHSWEV